MAALLESKAVLTSRAKSHGLSGAEIAVLVNAGVDNLAKLAFSITTPGVNPGEAELRGLLNNARPNEVSIGSLASIRRLMFDAQTLAIQNIKSQVDGSDSAKRELVPAERSVRIADQKARLAGYDLTGPLECSFASYDICVELQEKDAVYYLAPHKFTTRSSEVIKDKPGKELIIDANSLKINDTKNRDQILINNELELSQAFTRRALACDVVGIASFQRMEKWHRYLFQQMSHSPPPGYVKPTIEQVLRADRAGWVRMAEKLNTIQRDETGNLPLDQAFDDLQSDNTVTFHLLPLPGKAKPGGSVDDHDKDKPPKKDKKVKKIKGKGKMPKDLVGMNPNGPGGERLCYNYNLKHGCKFAKAGQSCKRGKHLCMKCHGPHPQMACKASE